MSSIESLPAHVAALLRSSIIVSSLEHVVLGLVKNSLDAQASRIDIIVHIARGYCTVTDDGHGYLPQHIYHPYAMTTPPTAQQTVHHGHHAERGCFLAAISTLSLLEIASKTECHRSTHTVTYHHGRLLSQTKARGPTLVGGSEPGRHGTIVKVRDLFSNMPVRVMQRASSTVPNRQREWFNVKRGITALCLAWPSQVSIRLEDASREQRTMFIPKSPNQTLPASDPNKRSSWAEIDTVQKYSILSRAGLVPLASEMSFVPVSATTSMFSIKGCISTTPSPHKNAQFISFGVRPCNSEQDFRALYDAVNDVFERSCFSLDAIEQGIGNKTSLAPDRHKPGKGLDCWPMFYLQVTTPTDASLSDMQGYRPAIFNKIKLLLQSLAHGWLKAHSFLRQDATQTIRPALLRDTSVSHIRPTLSPPDASPATLLAECSPRGRHFNDWSRVKNGSSTLCRTQIKPKCSVTQRPDQGSYKQTRLKPAPVHSDSSGADTSAAHPDAEPPTWFPTFFSQWENPRFGAGSREPPVPTIHNASVSCCGRCLSRSELAMEAEVVHTIHFTKPGLTQARVIAQVDQKYILVKMPVDDKLSLVLVDQHAASERCILEHLLQDLCLPYQAGCEILRPRTASGVTSAIRTKLLHKQFRFELAEEEILLIQERIGHFAYWGILYDIEFASSTRDTVNADTGKIIFVAVPDVIYERSVAEPGLLIELVRSEIWSGAGRVPGNRDINEKSELGVAKTTSSRWVDRMGTCPTRLLDMIHSRACRSAVMFNDKLSRAECRELICKLSACAFPFMCAHGRVSMVPVVDLPAEGLACVDYPMGSIADGETGKPSFITAFGKWQQQSKSGCLNK